MRSLLALLFAASLFAAERPAVDHAAYTAALKDFRKGAAKSIDALKKADAPAAVRLAAVDDVRERLVDEPTSPLTGEVAALLGSTDVETAKLLLAALAEAKAAGATAQVAALASKADSPLRIPAALALPIDGGCSCAYCKAHPEHVPSWDCLAVSDDKSSSAWTVHYPSVSTPTLR